MRCAIDATAWDAISCWWVEKSELPDIDFKYRIFNCSGGEVEMCGNGARCFAVFVRELGLTDKKMIACETVKGIIRPHIEDDGTVTVDMAGPVLRLTTSVLSVRGWKRKSKAKQRSIKSQPQELITG